MTDGEKMIWAAAYVYKLHGDDDQMIDAVYFADYILNSFERGVIGDDINSNMVEHSAIMRLREMLGK